MITSCILYTHVVLNMQTMKLNVVVMADWAETSEVNGQEHSGDNEMMATFIVSGAGRCIFELSCMQCRVEVCLGWIFPFSLSVRWTVGVGLWSVLTLQLNIPAKYHRLSLCISSYQLLYGAYNLIVNSWPHGWSCDTFQPPLPCTPFVARIQVNDKYAMFTGYTYSLLHWHLSHWESCACSIDSFSPLQI